MKTEQPDFENASHAKRGREKLMSAYLKRSGLTLAEWERHQAVNQAARDADPLASLELQRKKNAITHQKGAAQ